MNQTIKQKFVSDCCKYQVQEINLCCLCYEFCLLICSCCYKPKDKILNFCSDCTSSQDNQKNQIEDVLDVLGKASKE